MKNILCALSVSLLMAGSAHAAVIEGNTADSHVLSSTDGAQGGANTFQVATDPMRVGRIAVFGGRNAAAVFVFQIPDLSAVGSNPFASATLTFHVADNVSNNFAADLYGINARAAHSVISSDFYFGPATDTSADVTKLQDSILTSGTADGSVVISTDFTSWLNTQYGGGTGIGNYVFLRLSADNTNADVFNNNRGFDISSANAASNKPILTYTVIPEPATFGMLGVSALLLTQLRRRQRRS